MSFKATNTLNGLSIYVNEKLNFAVFGLTDSKRDDGLVLSLDNIIVTESTLNIFGVDFDQELSKALFLELMDKENSKVQKNYIMEIITVLHRLIQKSSTRELDLENKKYLK